MPPEILHASSSLLMRIAEPAARSLVLGCFAAAALGAFRVKSVSAKLFVWRGVLVAVLAMPLLGWVAPSIRVPVPAPSFVKHSASVPSAAYADADVAIGPGALLAAPVKTALLTTPASQNAPSKPSKYSTVMAPSELRNTPVRAPREIGWPAIAAAFYAVITLFFFARLLIGMRLGKRLERAAKPIEDARALAIAAAASRVAGLRVTPRLAESEMLSVPVTLGLRDSVVLFPAEWRDWEAGELEAVLAHEISHVSRRDALVQRLALIHRAVFWFSPLAWWLDRHLADLSEQASDEAALANGADRTRYAETLLGFFATLEAAPQRVWWQGVSMAKAGQAEKRVDRILAWRGAMSNRLKRSLVVGLIAVAAPVVVLTASVHPAVYNFQEPVQSPEQQGPPPPAARHSPAVAPVTPPEPAPSANPVVNVGPPPQEPGAPSVAPVAPVGPDTPVAAIAPEAPMAVIAPTAPVAGIAPVAPADWGPQDAPPGVARYTPEELSQLRKEVDDARESLNEVKAEMAAAKAELSSSATKAQRDEAQRAMATYKAAQANYAAALHEYDELLWQEKQDSHESNMTVHASHFMGRYNDWGPRFVIVTKNSDGVTMSGSEEDADHARSLKSKIPGDFIWFERDEKSYVIRDQATVDRAKKFWEPEEELGKKQEALGKQQEELGRQQEALGKKMEEVRVKIPDMTADMQALMAKMKELSANGGTQEEIGELQSQIGELQSRVGEIQSGAGRQQGEIGRQQGELGRKQGELGRQQGDLGRQQGELSRQASRQMKDLLDEAVSKGLAQPE
jgi:beta-lactamase regulating signal transducer with metallopeptidase domain/peptidoglycan hydrolase CwlO-like protein